MPTVTHALCICSFRRPGIRSTLRFRGRKSVYGWRPSTLAPTAGAGPA